jgi:ELWxxDGT repeat protein
MPLEIPPGGPKMRTRSFTFAALILLPTLLSAAQAPPAFLVRDIGTAVTAPNPLGLSSGTVALDGVLYFFSDDGVHGSELWRTDGTTAGTRMVRDLCPGVCSSYLAVKQSLTPFQHKVYWYGSDGAHYALMASDGTPQGTAPLLDPASPAAGHDLIPLGEAGGRLLLSGRTSGGGELWATDGTEAGTTRLRIFRTGNVLSNPALVGRLGGVLVFRVGDQTQTLWATDGTADGTLPLIAGTQSMGFGSAVLAGGQLFFETFGPSGDVGWVSDGTPTGTRPLPGVSFDLNLAAVGSRVFFLRLKFPDWELWTSDGTPDGTTLVKVLTDPPGDMAAVGNRLFLNLDGALWVSDGTADGTLQVEQLSVAQGFLAFGGRLAFFAYDGTGGLGPWISDGTADGTYPVAEIPPPSLGASSSDADTLGILSGRWLFAALDPQGWFLWSSDGTPDSLTRIRRLDVQTSSFPQPLADLDGTLLFSANNPENFRQELWRTDGSAAGTTQITANTDASPYFVPYVLGRIGSRLFFASDFPLPSTSTGGGTVIAGYGLWATDGTAAGTGLVLKASLLEIDALTAAQIGGSIYVEGTRSQQNGLFKTDGIDAGTVFLHRFNRYSEPLSQLLAVGDRLFFVVGVENTSLWTSDGTVAGTKPVLPGHTFLGPLFGTALGSRLFFTTYGETERELWASDGTAAGTLRIAGIGPRPPVLGGVVVGGPVVPGRQAVAGGRVFFVGDDGVHGAELWSTDGTAAGTHMVADIAPGSAGSSIGPLTVVGRRVYFAADDGVHGRELWTSDGTAAGTRIVADIAPGAGSSLPANLTEVDGRLLFSADDGVHGVEPWVSDGTAEGTRMLQDIAPGALPSSPSNFFISGDYVYFSANDAAHGFELWAIPRSALRAHP